MAVINLTRTHQLSLEEITLRVNSVVSKLEQKLDVKSEWENNKTLQFRRKGASGSIEISTNSVDISVRLGMMFRALKGVIQKELEEVLDKQLTKA